MHESLGMRTDDARINATKGGKKARSFSENVAEQASPPLPTWGGVAASHDFCHDR